MKPEISDPIVDEVRKAGEDYLARFNFDFEAACRDLQRLSEKAGRTPVAYQPRPVQTPTPAVKRVG